MGIHCVTYYEEPDSLEMVDIDYQCSRSCMMSTLERNLGVTGVDTAGSLNLSEGGSVSWGAYPCGDETDYDVYCSTCETLLWRGLQSEEGDDEVL